MIRRNQKIRDRLLTLSAKNNDQRVLSSFTGLSPTLDRHATHFVSYLYDLLLTWWAVLYFEKAMTHSTDRPTTLPPMIGFHNVDQCQTLLADRHQPSDGPFFEGIVFCIYKRKVDDIMDWYLQCRRIVWLTLFCYLALC